MLLLKRRVGERIIVNGDIVITVTAAGRGFAKLGFEAPAGVTINREEVEDRIRAEGKTA